MAFSVIGIMENDEWASSSSGASDSETYIQDANDEKEHCFASGSIPKLQFRYSLRTYNSHQGPDWWVHNLIVCIVL